MRCDFCDRPNVIKWEYVGHGHVLHHDMKTRAGADATIVFGDDGIWMACDECHALVEAGDLIGLRNRVVAAFHAAEPEAAYDPRFNAGMVQMLDHQYQKFAASNFACRPWSGDDAAPKEQ